MASILKVDTLQKPDGSTPTAADLGLNIAGSVVQVVQFPHTNDITGGAANVWVGYESQTFTPKYANSKLYIDLIAHLYANQPASTWEGAAFRLVVDGSSTYGLLATTTDDYGASFRGTDVGDGLMAFAHASGVHQVTSTSPITVASQYYAHVTTPDGINKYGAGYLRITEIAQ